MDLGVSILKSGYYTILENIFIAARAVSQIVHRQAAKEDQEKNEAADNVKNHLSVSGDGSWAKRGFTLLVGIVSLVGKFKGKRSVELHNVYYENYIGDGDKKTF